MVVDALKAQTFTLMELLSNKCIIFSSAPSMKELENIYVPVEMESLNWKISSKTIAMRAVCNQ